MSVPKTDTRVEDALECGLYRRDMLTDCRPSTEHTLEIGTGCQVVGVNVGFQNPINGQVVVTLSPLCGRPNWAETTNQYTISTGRSACVVT